MSMSTFSKEVELDLDTTCQSIINSDLQPGVKDYRDDLS